MTNLLSRVVRPFRILIVALGLLASFPAAAVQFAGLWRGGFDANYVDYGLDVAGLTTLVNQRFTNNLRVVSLRTYLNGATRVWAGVWRSGSGAEYININQSWDQFTTLFSQRFTNGLRLVDIETYTSGATRYWAGVWHPGSDGEYFYAGLSEDQIAATNSLMVAQNLRMIDVETYIDGGTRYWAGLWRSGTDSSAFASNLTDGGFNLVNQLHHLNGRELIDVESYPDSLGDRHWTGIWRANVGPTTSDLTMDYEKLNAQVGQRYAAGERMFLLSTYDVDCSSTCMNTLVSPDSYIYGITRTTTHCYSAPGTCSAPPGGSVVWYNWPVNTSPSGNTIRISAVSVPDQFLTLPFVDPQVKRRGIWRYSNGDWHHAADYSRDDVATFKVRAAAPGKVIFVGWDNWSGNSVIVSHNINGQTDNYRTIYMHLRNGKDNDCANAWNLTIPWFATRPDLAADKTNYLALLNTTGCPQDPALRNPNTNHWGLNTDTIRVSVGQQVDRGSWLAWAGQTGPGGNRNKNNVNTHLHIFFARRDPTDNNWYFFDPYGIYALPDCYPPGITDDLNTECVRYPIVWQNSHPQYPPPVLDFQLLYLGRLGNYLELSWEDPTAHLQSSRLISGPWGPAPQTNNPYLAPLSGPYSFFQLKK